MFRWIWPFASCRVFVSYAHEDQVVVEREIVGLLRTLPVDHWVDRQGVEPGEILSHAIARAIRRSSRVLVVVSRSSVASEWVQLEVEYACLKKKRVVPILLDDTPKEYLNKCLAGRLHLDFRREGPTEKKAGLRRLSSEIRREANRHAASWIAPSLLALLSIYSIGRINRLDNSEGPAEAFAVMLLDEAVEQAQLKESSTNKDVGVVLWSAIRNEGFVRIAGLQIRDPAVSQYQIWALDGERENPVDLGIFDVTASSETIIPLSPTVPVGELMLVFVTVEKPGGVVVSKRDLVVATAAF